MIEGLSVVTEMGGRATRSRTVSTASLKPFYTRPSDLRHPMEYGFAQMTWGAGLGLGGYSATVSLTYTLLDRRRVVSASGVARREYRGRYLDEVTSDWVSEAEALGSFIPLQVGMFHALWKSYEPSSDRRLTPIPNVETKNRPTLSMRGALGKFPIGTKAIEPYQDGNGRSSRAEKVYNFSSSNWRVRFSDNGSEKLTASEIKNSGFEGGLSAVGRDPS